MASGKSKKLLNDFKEWANGKKFSTVPPEDFERYEDVDTEALFIKLTEGFCRLDAVNFLWFKNEFLGNYAAVFDYVYHIEKAVTEGETRIVRFGLHEEVTSDSLSIPDFPMLGGFPIIPPSVMAELEKATYLVKTLVILSSGKYRLYQNSMKLSELPAFIYQKPGRFIFAIKPVASA